MAHWAVAIPIRVPGEQPRTGVQWFTYPASTFPCHGDVVEKVREDVDTETAIRHRAGAVADVGAIRVVWHDDVL
ncbi:MULTISPECIES: hypothetical protein [unclassified Streptomyces]|uniref:hypothetical protein n=1 Tax=unclassified Streptomyces TaxID=2593676 RepID=UPI0007465A0C|nr:MULTISPECIES: hypothetical protein [unclassified Streptomyces]KUL73952.1 hypothetical protein ADL34_19010 [Streptomyces sp. NRRL WC-3605]KUL74389.1 hypothetical protein ADL33_18025 [Streptomyces sp. NRRL WC-3604]